MNLQSIYTVLLLVESLIRRNAYRKNVTVLRTINEVVVQFVVLTLEISHQRKFEDGKSRC